jgi:hypothetical protein
MGGMLSSILIFLLTLEHAELMWIWSFSSRGTPPRGGLLVLSSFDHRSPHEAPPHEGLLRWASVFGLPLSRSWAVEGAQEQVDRDTPVS